MTRIHASKGTSVRSPGRPRRALAAAVLGALALTACGAEGTEGGGKAAGPAPSVSTAGGASSTEEGAAGGAKDGADGAAFAAMLARVAQPCPVGHAPADRPSAPAGGGEEPTVRPGEMPPTGPIEPGFPTSGPEVELSARDWCASGLHEERITQALLKLKDPAPAEVRKILNRLGYIDGRIHGLGRTGPATVFFLDLREKGGRLCVKGSAAGENTVVDTCVAPLSGEFSPANVGN
ncbi:hypothetical protein [Streptomyces sp. P9-A4]|uniref:hypothetical protein n=1 Tax=Streptomyces sp. P9-A4 TaxID=3072285 RepID=UPI002FCB3A59